MSKHAPRSANQVDKHVGSQIRLRRQVMGMSQEKLGDHLGVTFQQVQKYERGTNRVGASRLWRLSQVLGVPIPYFFEGLPDGIDTPNQVDVGDGPAVYDFIQSSDGVELAKAVSGIKEPGVRRQVLELARVLSKEGY